MILRTFLLGLCLALSASGATVTHATIQASKSKAFTLGNVAEKTERTYKWAVFVMGDDDGLDGIRCVEYLLHPTFPKPLRIVCDRGPWEHKGFNLEAEGWGTFRIHARVLKKDGSVLPLTHDLNFDVQASGRRILVPPIGNESDKVRVSVDGITTLRPSFTFTFRVARNTEGDYAIRFEDLHHRGGITPFDDWTFDVLANDHTLMTLRWRPSHSLPPSPRAPERTLSSFEDALEIRVLGRRFP